LREAVASGIAITFRLIPLPDGSLRVDLNGRQQEGQAEPVQSKVLARRNLDLLTDEQARIFCGYEAKGIKSWQRYKKRRRIMKIGGGQFDIRDLKAALDSERAGR
jgi:hypothetical protein